MGRLHARVYSQIPRVTLSSVYDATATTAAAVAEEFKCAASTDLDALLANVDAVTIAAPTIFHLELAERCLRRKIACLIEKPLAKNAVEAEKIAELSERHATLVQVGHIERFNPVIRAITALGVEPRYLDVSRISPMTFRSLDVGVVLDMMIHDIDIVLKLAASRVKTVEAVGVSVIGDVEDVCNARLVFENGCVANITASRLALKTDRKIRIYSPQAYISADYQKRRGMIARRSGNLETIRDIAARVRAGQADDLSQFNYPDIVRVEELKVEDVEPLRAELDAFVDAVTLGQKPVVSVADGLAAVQVAERIVAAIESSALA